MDELELLKTDWKKQDKTLPTLSAVDIGKMIWKRSSSIVKWIFYISILELAFWISLGFIFNTDSQDEFVEKLGIGTISEMLSYFNYAVFIFFIYKFWTNYKRISADDSTKVLMENIINTRKWVRYFVNYNLIMICVIIALFAFAAYTTPTELSESLQASVATEGAFAYVRVILKWLLFTGVFVGIFWVFYRVLYGILLSKLQRNYKELDKIEI